MASSQERVGKSDRARERLRDRPEVYRVVDCGNAENPVGTRLLVYATACWPKVLTLDDDGGPMTLVYLRPATNDEWRQTCELHGAPVDVVPSTPDPVWLMAMVESERARRE